LSYERYWFNTRTLQVESDDDRGPLRYLMGPYRSREHAAHALERASRRTQEWDEQDRRWASGQDPPPWAPEPVRLSAADRWVLSHRRAIRTGAIVMAVLLVALFVRDVSGDGDATFLPLLLAFQSLTILFHVREVDRRAERATSIEQTGDAG